MSEPGSDWQKRKKLATRERIRTCALRLFQDRGYEATTVEQIAAAAGVSHMTVFRYFPTKEDVALSDSYDPLIVELVRRTPATQPLIERIGGALLQGLRQLYDTDREMLLSQNRLIVSTPALRERLWANQLASQQVILDALDVGDEEAPAAFTTKVTVAACLAAATTAVLSWVENDGTPELPDLLQEALDTLAHPRDGRSQG
ncbi:MAG: TetR/AcrR family transcriptional regulator [Candidatus Dormibacteria bacterium]